MCGIAGYWLPTSGQAKWLEHEIGLMNDSLRHRGEDSDGIYIDENDSLALGHRRLAIVDLTAEGHQPMQSRSKRFWLTFNGEIYNSNEIKSRLESDGYVSGCWRGTSDTEVLIEGIDKYGLEETLRMTRGMFALGVWDMKNKKLSLARDRFGEKPLYWTWFKVKGRNAVAFASELKAITQLSSDDVLRISRDAFSCYSQFGCIKAPLSIYERVEKVEAGMIVDIEYDVSRDDFKCSRVKWWDVIDAFKKAKTSDRGSRVDRLNSFEEALKKSIKEQSNADVKTGIFLSGGLDSSLIASLLRDQDQGIINTFTVSFPDTSSTSLSADEGPRAKRIAEYLGTTHVDCRVDGAAMREDIRELPQIYDEPFSDSSQIASYILCREAKHAGLKVALGGDGGDELLGGYRRHRALPIIKQASSLPFIGEDRLARTLVNELFDSRVLESRAAMRQKISRVLRAGTDLSSIYNESLRTLGMSAITRVESREAMDEDFWTDPELIECSTMSERIMLADTIGYMESDILVKMDRASMAHSFETRAPFLSPSVAETAWSLPSDLKVGRLYSDKRKVALRKIAKKYLPTGLLSGKKQGFAVPIDQWMRRDIDCFLKSQLLDSEPVILGDLIDRRKLEHLINEHNDGSADHHACLWSALMWKLWCDRWVGS